MIQETVVLVAQGLQVFPGLISLLLVILYSL